MALDGPRTPQGVPYATLPHLVNSQGQYLYCKYWEPNLEPGQTPRALVFLSHGYKENCLRYDEFAKQLTAQGLRVFSHDHVGHGQSQGYRADVTSFDVLVNDVIQHVCHVRQENPGIPVFAVAHSVGALVAICVALKRPELLAGMVCTGAAVRFGDEPTWLKLLGLKVLAYFFPLWLVPGSDNEIPPMTRNAEETRKSREDPLNCHRRGLLLRFGIECLAAAGWAMANASSFTTPVLLLHGGKDPLTSPSGSTFLYEHFSSRDKQLKVYPDLLHEIIFELPEDTVVVRKDIMDWIVDRLPRQ